MPVNVPPRPAAREVSQTVDILHDILHTNYVWFGVYPGCTPTQTHMKLGPQDLAQCAIVCRTMSEVALSVLWRYRSTSARPNMHLWSLLGPDDSYEERRARRDKRSNPDRLLLYILQNQRWKVDQRWSRFQYYAGLIGEMEFGVTPDSLDRQQNQILLEVHRFNASVSSSCLFGSLRCIYWNSMPTALEGPTLHSILTPLTTVTQLYIALVKTPPSQFDTTEQRSHGNDPVMRAKEILQQFPRLEQLTIKGEASDDCKSETTDTCDYDLRELVCEHLPWLASSRLSHVRICTPVTLGSLVVLATIPTLSLLFLHCKLPSHHVAKPERPAESNLRTLLLHYPWMASLPAVSDSVQFPHLEFLKLAVDDMLEVQPVLHRRTYEERSHDNLNNVRRLLTGLSTSPLRRLELFLDPRSQLPTDSDARRIPPPSPPDFMPLARLLGPGLSSCAHWDIEKLMVTALDSGALTVCDDDIAQLARAWPQLRVLHLDCQSISAATAPPSPRTEEPNQRPTVVTQHFLDCLSPASRLSIRSLITLARRAPHLQELHLPSFPPDVPETINEDMAPFTGDHAAVPRRLRWLTFRTADPCAHRWPTPAMVEHQRRQLYVWCLTVDLPSVARVVDRLFPSLYVADSAAESCRMKISAQEVRPMAVVDEDYEVWETVYYLLKLLREGHLPGPTRLRTWPEPYTADV